MERFTGFECKYRYRTMKLPRKFIDEGLTEVRSEILSNLRSGGAVLSSEYYTSIAAVKVWYCLVEEKNSDSLLDHSLRFRDIKMACRLLGFECRDDNGDLYVKVSGHSFMFCEFYQGVYGGPCDDNGHYQGYSVSEINLRISTRTLIRLMYKMSSIYDTLRGPVTESIHLFVSQFRTMEIMEATLMARLEPSLEDIPFRYRCNCDEFGESVDVWLYYRDDAPKKSKNEINLYNLGYQDLLDNMENYTKQFRDISYGVLHWKKFKGPRSPKGLPFDLPDERPTPNTPKLF